MLGLLSGLGIPTGGLQIVAGGPAWAHPGRSATLQFGPKGVIGAFGEVHPKILKALDVKGLINASELLWSEVSTGEFTVSELLKLRIPGAEPKGVAFFNKLPVKAMDALLIRRRAVIEQLKAVLDRYYGRLGEQMSEAA